jgi:signal recognition particle subunit SRP54
MMPQDVKVDDTRARPGEGHDRVDDPPSAPTPSSSAREAGRIQRVAKGAGRKPEEAVAELIAKFMMMRDMMGGIGQQAGLLSKMPGAKQLAMARRLRDAVKVQGDNRPWPTSRRRCSRRPWRAAAPGARR